MFSKKTAKPLEINDFTAKQAFKRRYLDYESATLPTELCQHNFP
uniref:Uncharacterized protein n=1 Tax=Siphoviridae sp. ctNEy24 TaxID=2825466 RepID=A0A8S5U0I6_9CAUD|nr:MAG TPA: hypothetical protein [Siphoviridae sp. ctNEy24]